MFLDEMIDRINSLNEWHFVTFSSIIMTALSYADIFTNAMEFTEEHALLRKMCRSFCPQFNVKNLRYMVVGGYALIFHKFIRNTMDIDIIVHEEDFQEAKKVCRT